MGAVLPKFKTKLSEYRLVPSGGGKFEISVDGKLLFSKLESGHFPENREVLKLIEKVL
jgi:selenoprotein W-related protein